jgi:DeoR family ulaG and ulaABCDEF operon transcriptional repressor
MGGQAITQAGMFESHPLVVKETEMLLSRADEVIVLADSRKFGMRARHAMMPLSRIGTVITDDGLSEANHRMLTEAGIRVIVAPRSGEADQG